MPGSPVKIGPFTGGLNTYSDPTAVADAEVVELVNFDIDIDGSLVTRPPVVVEDLGPAGTPNLRPLGWYTDLSGTSYLLFSSYSTAGTYAYRQGTWTTITTDFSATSFVTYNNLAWIVAPVGSPYASGTWSLVAGFTAVPAMKKGTTAVVYKERMWIGEGGPSSVNSNRLYFSTPANFTVWNPADFIDIKPGDGQDIIALFVFADAITIFKQNSTYIFSYDSRVASGQVRLVSNTIGIANRDSIVEYENLFFVLHDDNLYAVTNWNYEKLNIKVPFLRVVAKAGISYQNNSLSIVGDRILVSYRDNVYVYGLKSHVWSMWKYVGPNLSRFFEVPFANLPVGVSAKYIAASTLSTDTNLWNIQPEYAIDRSESIFFSLTTRTFDFEEPHTHKRLFWWGADAVVHKSIKGTLSPVTYGRSITWVAMRDRTWAETRAFTWGRLSDVPLTVENVVTINGGSNRIFVKFLKTLRFRQVHFSIEGALNGTPSQSPLRLYSLTAFLSTKSKVAQKIN